MCKLGSDNTSMKMRAKSFQKQLENFSTMHGQGKLRAACRWPSTQKCSRLPAPQLSSWPPQREGWPACWRSGAPTRSAGPPWTSIVTMPMPMRQSMRYIRFGMEQVPSPRQTRRCGTSSSHGGARSSQRSGRQARQARRWLSSPGRRPSTLTAAHCTCGGSTTSMVISATCGARDMVNRSQAGSRLDRARAPAGQALHVCV